jgi:hypothetical protein
MKQLRWRKFSPIDRDYPLYELTVGDDMLLDVTRDASGAFEIRFEQEAVGKTLDLDEFIRLLAEARELLANETPDPA